MITDNCHVVVLDWVTEASPAPPVQFVLTVISFGKVLIQFLCNYPVLCTIQVSLYSMFCGLLNHRTVIVFRCLI